MNNIVSNSLALFVILDAVGVPARFWNNSFVLIPDEETEI